MIPSHVPGARLLNQGIADAPFTTPAQVVSWLGAMQAQDYPGAKWSVGLRLPAATDDTIESALASGSIVRTWPMRGTLHFVAAPDLRWMVDLLAPRVIAGMAGRWAQLGLDVATFERAHHIFGRALDGGKRLTRKDLLETLERGGVHVDGQRGYHMLFHAAMSQVICFGPPRGKTQTFVLLDEWVPRRASRSREESLAELAARYFTSHGPASLPDFSGWAGLTAADARLGIEAAGSTLAKEEVERRTLWMAAAGSAPGVDVPGEHLLPGFDEYLLGYKDRRDVLDAEFAQAVCPGKNGVFAPTIIAAGRVVGTWRRTVGKSAVAIETSLFGEIGGAEKLAIERAAQRYGRFLGMPATVAWI